MDSDRFTALFQAHSARVYAYARRRSSAEVAEEVVAATFLVAWQKIQRLPDEPLPWLLVTARYELLRTHRTQQRQEQLSDALSQHLSALHLGDETYVEVAERRTALLALQTLSEVDREALLLTVWDGLTADEAATVQGCRKATFQVRLSRARTRFRDALAASSTDSTHEVTR